MRIFPGAGGDRSLLLLVLSSVLAVVLGFLAFPSERSLNLVIGWGYWVMLVTFAAWVWSLVGIARQEWAEGTWRGWRSWPRWPAMLVGACGTVLLVHEPYGFKILMDEAMLLGTSLAMHFEKMSLVPMRANDIQGAFQIVAGQLDKRPLFQPFLTSILHDLTGYRPENVFVLNSLLTFVLLGLAFRLGRWLAGGWGGALAVLMLASLPLLAQNATGGGFELLNLVMIVATLLLAVRYAGRRDAVSLQALVFGGILLAYTRYESVLFLLPVAAVVLLGWWRERRPVLTPLVACAPLFLVLYALHHQVFRVREESWELKSLAVGDRPFSPAYLPDNLGHALNFFLNTNGEQSNSLVITVLGGLALPFLALWAARILRAWRAEDPGRVAVAAFAGGLAVHTLLLLCYFWGRFDDPVIRRLSLPLNLTMVLGAVVVVPLLGARALRIAVVLAVAGIFGHSLPAMARHDFTQDYYVGREAAWRREFIAAHPERDYLFIDNSSIFWIAHLVSATPMIQATQHKENLVFHHRNRSFSALYVFQRLDVADDTGKLTVQPDDDLGPDYELETVAQRRFTPLRVSRISRVTAIREGGAATPATRPAPAAPLPAAEQEKVRDRYFQNFVKKLP